MKPIRTPIDSVIWKLNNCLRGSAMLCKDAHYLTPEEKMEEMKAIEAMLKYINAYEENIAILERYKKEEIER